MSRTRKRRGTLTVFKQAARLTAAVVREQERMRKAARSMPKPVPWEWAEQRVLPLLAGPYFDADGLELVRTVMDPGCAVVFGLDLGMVFPLVDTTVAERWECTAEQITEVAVRNLRTRAAALGPATVTRGTMSGRIISRVENVGWISSLVLIEDELMRLFGSHDQLLAAPGTSSLISLPVNTPTDVVADIVVDLEEGQSYPLMLDPFAIMDGRLYWSSDELNEDID
jgi:uncharacterized protein YtpQ (UPF0354 family)